MNFDWFVKKFGYEKGERLFLSWILWKKGFSLREIERITKEFFGEKVSRSTLWRLMRKLGEVGEREIPEPVELKREARKFRSLEEMVRYLWEKNKIGTYLWRYFKPFFGDLGWRKFQRVLAWSNSDIALWIAGRISWEEFIKRLWEKLVVFSNFR